MSTPNNPFYELSSDIKSLLAIETFRVGPLISHERFCVLYSFKSIGKRFYNRLYREDIEWRDRPNEEQQ